MNTRKNIWLIVMPVVTAVLVVVIAVTAYAIIRNESNSGKGNRDNRTAVQSRGTEQEEKNDGTQEPNVFVGCQMI